jgi:hypothetical protein
MTRIALGLMPAVIALACASTAPTVKIPTGRGFSYEVDSHVRPVGDVPGHIAGSWETRGVCLDNVGQKDEEAGVMTASGTFDAVFPSQGVVEKCTSKAKTTCTFRDGSHTDETTAQCRVGPDGFLIFEARGVFVGGTGRFAGIQGSVSSTTWHLSPPSENLSFTMVTAEVTLPKK